MAKQVKNKSYDKKVAVKSVKKPTPQSNEPFWGLEKFFEKNERSVILALLLISLIFSFLQFDIRISEGGDDSGYIQSGWNFIKFNKFPFYQGPLYPLVLALPLALFGINLFILKSLSVLFALGNIWFMYLAFRKRIPYMVLFSLLFFIAVNNFFQYYASQTYTESFFLFVQAVAIYFVMRMIDTMPALTPLHKDQKLSPSANGSAKIDYKGWLLIGLLFALMSLAKSIAVICIVPVLLFFIFYKNYRYALYCLLGFVVCKGLIELIIRLSYQGGSGQLSQILLKDLYKPELGYEGVSGLIDRFMANFQQFTSVSVLKILHLRDALAFQPDTFLALLVAVILVLTVIFSYRKNKYIFFAGIYLLVLCGGIFGGIQANNKQDRLMLIAMPFIFIVLIHGLYRLTIKSSVLRFYFFLFLVIYLFYNLSASVFADKNKGGIDGIVKNFPTLKKNLAGDKYYGYTDDWVNYLKMSAWCADSLPPNSLVAARKASMSFIYGNGKEFYPVFMVFSNNPDTILAKFKKDSVTHIIVASLRQNPRFNNGQVINTMQRLLHPIDSAYSRTAPKLTFVKRIGESEPAELWKFNY